MNQSTSKGGNGTQGDGGSTGEEGEDQEDSSSSWRPTTGYSEDKELANFRAEWRKELESGPTVQQQSALSNEVNAVNTENKVETDEEKARKLFLKGIENEQMGKLYEAIQFYRRAVQLVPDIEFRLYESTKNQRTVIEPSEKEEGEREKNVYLEDDDDVEEFDPSQCDLTTHLQRVMSKSYCFCQFKIEQKTTHISMLPIEIMLYILRWVVSSDLDMRSLEMCSEVCRGFYVCTRDPEIWRLACIRVWGVNCGGLSEYKTWREMFISKPRIHFNGCYISKTTYVRSGENSFQDQFYRPWHFVQYYRYLRFFPEGLVLMLTTADEPVTCLGLLKTRQVRHPAVLIGHYRLINDRVSLTVQKQQENIVGHKYRSRKNNNTQEQTFHLEFEIVSRRSKSHGQLRWSCYSVFTKNRSGHETSSAFEVVGSRFPPLWFSRVKSYTAEADYPLM